MDFFCFHDNSTGKTQLTEGMLGFFLDKTTQAPFSGWAKQFSVLLDEKQEPRKRFYFLGSCSSCLIYIIWYFSAKKINHHFYHYYFIYINRAFLCIILENSEYHKNGSTFLLHLKAVTANIHTSKNEMVKLFEVFSGNILKSIRVYAIVRIEIGLVERPRSYLIGGETPRHLF